jgi:hypothetical protein
MGFDLREFHHDLDDKAAQFRLGFLAADQAHPFAQRVSHGKLVRRLYWFIWHIHLYSRPGFNAETNSAGSGFGNQPARLAGICRYLVIRRKTADLSNYFKNLAGQIRRRGPELYS